MGTKKLRLALVGLGNQGQEHLLGMHNSRYCHFVAGVDESSVQREKTRALYPEMQFFSAIEELLVNSGQLALDGLVLCLPHHCYANIWPMVARLQLPILKEKPLARNLNEARLLQQQLGHKYLKTAIQRRHHPSYQKLKQLLQEDNAQIQEVHTWLHLGRQSGNQIKGDWRANQNQSGGGILLDAGYHLVDLLHFFIGSIELISCTLWRNRQRCHSGEVEDAAQLLARNEQCWVSLDARLGGDSDELGQIHKSEGIRLQTDQGIYFANRNQIEKNGEIVWQGERDWQQAMALQLDSFARDIQQNHWYASTYWDHIPAMKLIEAAYQSAYSL